ncbi:MAG: rhodanese-like domain-containing protein [Candidatus Omnitrophica bacterium]|nr:rhodanese-like domain-containing protein [Candidatus Omnitrophota bacterium]
MKIMEITRKALEYFTETGKSFTLVDVLPRELYNQEHIAGAVSMPLGEIEKSAATMLPDKHETVIVYCASFDCPASTRAAEILMGLGYIDVLDYKGGLKDYKEYGGKLEGTLHRHETEKDEAEEESSSGCCDCMS